MGVFSVWGLWERGQGQNEGRWSQLWMGKQCMPSHGHAVKGNAQIRSRRSGQKESTHRQSTGMARTHLRVRAAQVAEESLELALLAAHPGASASGRTPSARMSASALPLHASMFFCSDVKLLSTLHLLHPRACAARPQPAPAPCQWRARMPGAGSAGVRVCQQRLDLVHMFRHDLLARCMRTCACRGPPPCTPYTWAEGWEEESCGM